MFHPTCPRATARTAALLLVAWLAGAGPAAAATVDDEVRATFDRFVRAQNAHDVKALEGLLADSPQFLWTTRGTAVWGRAAALARFAKLYEGTWKLEPEMAGLRVVPLGDNVAQLHVPITFTAGPAGQPPQTVRNFINQVLVKSADGWRVMSIFPVPAPAP